MTRLTLNPRHFPARRQMAGGLRWLTGILCATVLIASPAAAKPKEGQPAPVVTATLISGEKLTLNQHPGRVTLISYWATWCPPCRKEMPVLDRLYREHHDAGLDLLGVSMDAPSDLPAVKTFTRELHYPIALQRDVDARAFGRIWAVPLLFIVDRRGTLRVAGWAGMTEQDFPALENTVKALLAENP